MRKLRKIINQSPPTFAFVVDGQTESWYLQMLKRNERHLRLNIKPEIPHKKSLEDQFKLVIDLSQREYSSVFWIVDLDTVIRETKQKPKGAHTPIEAFAKFKEELHLKYKNVKVLVNNPCLEYWFLLHYEKTSRFFDSCTRAQTELKKYLKDYEKTKKYFTKEDDDIYRKLKPYLKNAVENAQNLGAFDWREQNKAISEMYFLFRVAEMKNCL